jgi:hypothetical protein
MRDLPYNDVTWIVAHLFTARRPRPMRHRLRICRAGVSIDLFAPLEPRLSGEQVPLG